MKAQEARAGMVTRMATRVIYAIARFMETFAVGFYAIVHGALKIVHQVGSVEDQETRDYRASVASAAAFEEVAEDMRSRESARCEEFLLYHRPENGAE